MYPLIIDVCGKVKIRISIALHLLLMFMFSNAKGAITLKNCLKTRKIDKYNLWYSVICKFFISYCPFNMQSVEKFSFAFENNLNLRHQRFKSHF